MGWTLPPNRKWFRLKYVREGVPWWRRVRAWVWLRRVERIIRREIDG